MDEPYRLGQKSRKFFRCYFGINDYFIRTLLNYLTFRCHQDCNLKSNISNLSTKILKISRFSFLQNNFLPKLKNIWNPEPYVLASYQLIFRISQTLNTYVLMKSSKKYFIFSFACYLIICLMISPKNFGDIVRHNQVTCKWKDKIFFWTFH